MNTFCSAPGKFILYLIKLHIITVGMLDIGEQKLIIGQNCLRNGKTGAVIHELMHTLGFGHEHQRADRDKHLKFKPQNVRKGNMGNFRKVMKSGNIPAWARLGTEYDYRD